MQQKLGGQRLVGNRMDGAGELSKDPLPLAAFRMKRSRQQGELEDSIRDLLESLSTVDRFVDKNATKSGALEKATAPAKAVSVEQPSQDGKLYAEAREYMTEFVPTRVRVMTALFLAELSPQLKFLPPEDRQRLYSLFESPVARKTNLSRNTQANRQSSFDSLAGPQTRKTLRPTEISGTTSQNAPGLVAVMDDEENRTKRAEEDETAILKVLQLPPLRAELNDICMDGMTGTDIILFLVEWTVKEIISQDQPKA